MSLSADALVFHLVELLLYYYVCCFVLPALSSSFPGCGQVLDAFVVALGQASEGLWYTTTMELQLASFEFLDACRGVRTLQVIVAERMPLSLWDDDDNFSGPPTTPAGRRRPGLRAASVDWRLPADVLVPLISQAALLKGAETMRLTCFPCEYSDSTTTDSSRWDSLPSSLTRRVHSPRSYFEAVLHFIDPPGRKTRLLLVQDLGSVSWPPALLKLSLNSVITDYCMYEDSTSASGRLYLGNFFEQPITSISWPASLTHLTLGKDFNQPLTDVELPASLLQLVLGDRFNHPITAVAWPVHLRQLMLGASFNQPITEAVWPIALRSLAFGRILRQPIEEVAWPASLRWLVFSDEFIQPTNADVWPPSLVRVITYTRKYRLVDAVECPSSRVFFEDLQNVGFCLAEKAL